MFTKVRSILLAVARSFLFTTARKLIVDSLRHERIDSIHCTQGFGFVNVLEKASRAPWNILRV